ncbi:hypothetical protein HanRHA438_Chr09g0401581 [Helianthus annuus]|nr:hypothetical protein HanRHA438_Chr09g0401581 [Helianthus annuus]
MCLITAVKTFTFHAFFRSCGFLYGGGPCSLGIPDSTHQSSSPLGHHGGATPFSNGNRRCGGSQCCIKADKSEPSVVS